MSYLSGWHREHSCVIGSLVTLYFLSLSDKPVDHKRQAVSLPVHRWDLPLTFPNCVHLTKKPL